ncbi:AAA family ATPase [Paenibacillus sp. 2TAB26]|uniref:AAA family ATPase n=1 Tax=Paenibacillus sp. 2TAB26 TaxID=3233005 RepID=UPI003F96A486
MTTHSERKLSAILSGGPLQIEEFMKLSIEMTELVHQIHQHNETIGNLNPSTITVDSSPFKIKLTDSVSQNKAYRSPEQSNLIVRKPDRRSDLYSLGMIFYEMLTSRLPYEPLQHEDWNYVHLVYKPVLLREAAPYLRESVLEVMIWKLLAKNPDDRYQTAYGLLMDLKQFASYINDEAPSLPFDIGKYDLVSRFQYPASLFGRASELGQLEAAFRRALEGEYVSLSIKGDKGTGKTSLAAYFRQRVDELGGVFIQARCETGQQNVPFKPILHVVTEWFKQIWNYPANEIIAIKSWLQRELGNEISLLAGLLPEANLLWKDETNVPLSLGESENRTEDILHTLMRCIAQNGSPLILFLDDAEWLDLWSLALVDRLTKERTVNGMMLVTASRSDQGAPAERIVLDNLQYNDILQLISAIVSDDSPRVHTLARSAYHRTEGNPERLQGLLTSWYLDKKLYYDTKRHQWMWEEEIIVRTDESIQVIRLFEARYLMYSEQTKLILAVASVMGMRFHSSLLARICDCSEAEAEHHLKLAESQGIISRDDGSPLIAHSGFVYAFVYSSFQQFLYTTLEGDQGKWHLKIGRAMHERLSNDEPTVFLAAVDHLNRGLNRMTDPEKRELAKLNECAGEKAVQLQKYQEAKRFYEQGLKLEGLREEEPDEFTSRMMLQYAACLYYCAEVEQSREQYLNLLPFAHRLNDKDRSFLAISQINMNALVDNAKAVQCGLEALTRYGWTVPRSVSKASLLKEIIGTQRALRNVRNKLKQLPDGQADEAYLTTAEIVLSVSLPWLIHNPAQFIWLMTRFIRYGLNKGLIDSLISLICMYEMIIQRSIPNLYDWLPTRVMEPLYSVSDVSSVQQYRLLFFLGLSKQLEYPKESAQDLRKVMRRAVESSDAITANLAMITCMITHNEGIRELDELLSYIQDETLTIPDDKTLALHSAAKLYTDALKDESLLLRYVSVPERLDRVNDDNYRCICKLEAAYLAGKHEEALFWANRGRDLKFSLDWVQNRKLRIYEALALAGLAMEAAPKKRRVIVRKLEQLSRKMKKWTGIFGRSSAMHGLIQAECNRLTGRTSAALLAYEAAISKAKEEGHGLSEAIASERLSSLYEEIGSPIGAAISLMNACMTYSDWGILAKVNQLQTKRPELWHMTVGVHGIQAQSPIERNESETKKRRLPLTDQAVSHSEEIILQQISTWTVEGDAKELIRSFLETACRQVGADRGMLIDVKEDDFQIAETFGADDRSGRDGFYAESIVRHVCQSGQTIRVGHAASSSYAKDAYIRKNTPQAILCMPVHVGVDQRPQLLYLENTQMRGVFSERSLTILELMVSRSVYMSFLNQSTANEWEAAPSSARSEMGRRGLAEPLTPREMDVLIVIADGLSNKEIGGRLGISEATVKTHIVNIYGKMEVRRRSQAIARAKELGLI